MAASAQLRNALRLAGSGLPRLWHAARGTGAGLAPSLDAMLGSAMAFTLAARGGPVRWRRQNAVRHFTWQAYLTARHGERLAIALAEAQERGSVDLADSDVDQQNNAAGRRYGLAHAHELRSGSRRAAFSRLTREAGRRWHSRELSSPPLPDGSDPRGT